MDRTHFLELRIPPPVVFLFCAAFIWLLSIATPWVSFEFPAKNSIAMAVAAVGSLFAGAGVFSILSAGTTLSPEKPDKTTKLVVTGVYRISRNPMYLSLLLFLISLAIYLGNLAAAIPVPFFVIYINRFQIEPEERALTSRFGSEFEAYSRHVRRWL
jgi:protein-S-isoprenylcysteine O-methyltransferase Ste14